MQVDPQLIAALIFLIGFSLFLFINRKNIEIQGSFPILYGILYRAKWGLTHMDLLAKRHPKLISFFSISGIYVGVLGMIAVVISLGYGLYSSLTTQQANVALIQPFVQTEPTSGFLYVPFLYFIISIFILATVHEFAHGVVSRLYNVKVKSSGFAFFSVLIPIIPGAFVEPDEKQVQKIKPKEQLGIYAAGPFSNLILAGSIILLLILVINPFIGLITTQSLSINNYYIVNNQSSPAQMAGVPLGDIILEIEGTTIQTTRDFISFMETTTPGQEVLLVTNSSSYPITLHEHPTKPGAGYIGVSVFQLNEYTESFETNFGWLGGPIAWFSGLLFWLIILNFGIGMMNLLPAGPLDGGRMLRTMLHTKIKDTKKADKLWARISWAVFILLLANFVPVLFKFF